MLRSITDHQLEGLVFIDFRSFHLNGILTYAKCAVLSKTPIYIYICIGLYVAFCLRLIYAHQ